MDYINYFSFKEIFSVFMVLFAVIDITGSIPIIINLKAKYGKVEAGKASLVSYIIMLAFFFFGESLLNIFGVDIYSFAIAGSFVVFALALEMVLGVDIFKGTTPDGASIVPLAFPLIAGAGAITTLLSLKAEFHNINIFIGLSLNMILVYLVIKSTRFFEKVLGKSGIMILRKVFGVILLAIAIKLFLTNTGIHITKS
ncbi:MAG TPA: MarC family protein [Bacteroidales bacterium]|nr:MarC family protein [Bacteroidales bacterium]